MKTKAPLATAFVLILSVIHVPKVVAQGGSLTPPPGPPSPTMKTLDQVEARTIINDTNTPGDATNLFIISAPGSYYLTGNITGEAGKHGISIQSNDVTLDLNGFSLIGVVNSLAGVHVPAVRSGFGIRNGTLRGWASGGVDATLAMTSAEKLRLSENVIGLSVGNGSIIKDCVAADNGDGFRLPDRSQANNCIASKNGVGFNCASYVNLMDCTASRNAGRGIVVLGSSSVIRCSATRSGGSGIDAGTGCTISDCTSSNNVEQGIKAGAGSSVRNCTAQGNIANGIYCFDSNCLVIGNTCDSNYAGIAAVGRIEGNSCTSNQSNGFLGGGLVIRNSARGNVSNFSVSGAVGPIVDMTAGGTITTTSPWANFSY